MHSWSPRSLSFRSRTILISGAVALTPFILFAAGVITEVRTSLLEKARGEHKAILTGILQQIRETLRNYEKLIQHLANDKRMQSMGTDRIHDALHNFHRFNDFFISTFVYDRDETIRFIEHRNHYTGERKLLGRRAGTFSPRFGETVARVLADGRPAYFDHIVDDETQSFLLFMAPIEPFTGTGSRVGVVSSAVQLFGHQFQELLEPVELEGQGYCLILDRRNRVIARRGRGLPAVLRAVDLSGFEGLDGAEGLTTTAIVDGREDVLSIARMPAMGCTVIVGSPQAEVLAFLRVLTLRIVLFGLFALILGIVCALYLSRSLLRPILSLTEGIQKVAEGATGHRLEVEGEDELADASRAFNRMASYLQKSRLLERIWKDKWSDRE